MPRTVRDQLNEVGKDAAPPRSTHAAHAYAYPAAEVAGLACGPARLPLPRWSSSAWHWLARRGASAPKCLVAGCIRAPPGSLILAPPRAAVEKTKTRRGPIRPERGSRRLAIGDRRRDRASRRRQMATGTRSNTTPNPQLQTQPHKRQTSYSSERQASPTRYWPSNLGSDNATRRQDAKHTTPHFAVERVSVGPDSRAFYLPISATCLPRLLLLFNLVENHTG